MAFRVTALKWRPQKFEEVVGQEHVSRTLKNSIKSNRIAHAYIFAGPRGVGKTTTARIFTRSINCLEPKDGEPCNECAVCKSFQDGKSLDIIEIDGASNRRIEEVRNLLESVKYAPTRSKFKVYIIDEVHMLTTESFNALLKTLEEPPEHTKFIFATTDIHKVPPTITSRCQRFDFRRIEVNDIKSLLKKIAGEEKIEIDDKSLTFISKKADGALRDAESLFDQVVSFCGNTVDVETLSKMLNLIDEEIFFEITDAILTKNFSAAFDVTQKIYDNGWNFIDFSNGLTEHFRNILTIVIRKDTKLIEVSENSLEKYSEYKDKFSEADLIKILAYLNTYQYELKNTTNQKLKTEISLANIISLEKSSTINQLIEIVSKGEFPQIDSTEKKKTINKEPSKKTNIIQENELVIIQDKQSTNKSKKEEKIFSPETANEMWGALVIKIKNERSLFGSVLEHVELVPTQSTKIKLLISSKEDLDILTNEQSYLDKKIKKVFGKEMKFELIQQDSVDEKSLESFTETNSNGKNQNELVNAIIEELGGQEIIR